MRLFMRYIDPMRRAGGAGLAVWLLAAAGTAQADYLRGDYNLDGVVDTNDYALWAANVGRTSYVPRAETILTTSLRVKPDRRTVIGGESKLLTSSGVTGTVHWGFVQHAAGGELTATSGVTVSYVGGLSPSNIDVVQIWDAENNLTRSYFNVISTNEASSFGKAIIVAGGLSPDDQVWHATEYLANRAYNVLRYRGFPSLNVDYLSYAKNIGGGLDADGDGSNDVDDVSSYATVANAFTNWAHAPGDLLVYLVDHGGENGALGTFNLNGNEQLSGTNLAAWLNRIQDTFTNNVTVILDFCYAGTFLANLAYPGTNGARRVVLAATESGRPTYFLGSGAVSFSEMFWGGILQGQSIAGAFQLARDGMASLQSALLDANGDGVYSNLVDGVLVTGLQVGATFVAGKDFPIIAKVLANQTLSEGTEALLWADDIASYYPLDRVWCTIQAPSHINFTDTSNPITDVPEHDLLYDLADGRYEETVDGFAEQGTYTLYYFAQDIWGSISPPKVGSVTQAGRRESLILVNGVDTNAPEWPAHRALCDRLYSAFRLRQFTTNRIYYLSADGAHDADNDGSDDVDGVATYAGFVNACTNWARSNDVLNVYLVGLATNEAFALGGSNLPAATLDALLDGFQSSSQLVRVVLEFPSAASYLPSLAAPVGRDRMVIAAAQAGRTNDVGPNGYPSFSSTFASMIAQGATIGRSYAKAAEATRQSSTLRQGPLPFPTPQSPAIDDNGDGTKDKYSTGLRAATRYFGAAFVTGDDAPVIRSVMPITPLDGATSMTIWAADVVDVNGITAVVARVRGPSGYLSGELTKTNLTRAGTNNHYEAVVDGLARDGNYEVTFSAWDATGRESAPAMTTLTGPDAYEPDDSSTNASFFYEYGAQYHNFHVEADPDWARFIFSATDGTNTNNVVSVMVYQTGTNVDAALDLYYRPPGGGLTFVTHVDEAGIGATLDESFTLAWNTALEGTYYVHVHPATNIWGAGSDYVLNIDKTTGAAAGTLTVDAISDLDGGLAPPNTAVYVDGSPRATLIGANNFSVPLSPGVHTVQVFAAAGYLPEQHPTLPNEIQNLANSNYGNPRRVTITSAKATFREFFFEPVVTVTGAVADRITGEPVAGASIEFQCTTGLYAGYTYNGYPNFATYKTVFTTSSDGAFSAGVRVPARQGYNLRLTKPGYSNLVWLSQVQHTTTAAQQIAISPTALLSPVDENGNGVADIWEGLHLGQLVSGADDADEDGVDDRGEYLAGTDPTNAASVLESDAELVDGVWLFQWPVAPGRSYRVRALDDLLQTNWSVAGGPWTATVGQASMSWTDSLPATVTGRLYRVELQPP